MGQVSFLRAPGKRCFIFQFKLKKEDEVWTSADSCEDKGDFAPDKQVSFTVQNRCLAETIVSLFFYLLCKYSLEGMYNHILRWETVLKTRYIYTVHLSAKTSLGKPAQRGTEPKKRI